ncbi:phage holin [Bacillus mojavensis]|uniref:phage holin n=1 Tax=Bacillus mojavensis TaxID=72360 RepID=UPI002E159594
MDHIVGPTIQGMSDSEQALEYDSPKKPPIHLLFFRFLSYINLPYSFKYDKILHI